MKLTSTSKGPLFESKIQVRTYPKEFIFAEKLETVIHRGIGNTRMKDFHDLYSLIFLEGCLDGSYTEKVVLVVFNHRHTPLQLPLKSTTDFLNVLQPLWKSYQRNLPSYPMAIRVPEGLQDVIATINNWLMRYTQLSLMKQLKKTILNLKYEKMVYC